MHRSVLTHYCLYNRYINEGRSCAVTRGNWLAGLLMYASYFFLFASFAVVRYCGGGTKKNRGKKKKIIGEKKDSEKGDEVANGNSNSIMNNRVDMPRRRRKVHATS